MEMQCSVVEGKTQLLSCSPNQLKGVEIKALASLDMKYEHL